MYDLRYASSGIARHPQPNKPNHTSTKPYISFHEYENDHISHDELDVSPEIGLLACSKFPLPSYLPLHTPPGKIKEEK